MENFERSSKDLDGIKLNVSIIRDISESGRENLPKSIKNKVKLTFKPLGVVFVKYSDIKNPDLLARWVYQTFGQGHYRLLYYRKLGAWRRRLTKLCWVNIWDADVGEYGFEITRGLGNLRRFSWFR